MSNRLSPQKKLARKWVLEQYGEDFMADEDSWQEDDRFLAFLYNHRDFVWLKDHRFKVRGLGPAVLDKEKEVFIKLPAETEIEEAIQKATRATT